MARIVGVRLDEVNVTGDPRQPWKQGIAVPVAIPAAVGLLTPPQARIQCQQDGEPQCHAAN